MLLREAVLHRKLRENGKYLKHSRNSRPMKETLPYLIFGR